MSIPFKTTDLQDIFSKLRTQIASTGSYELENELMSLRETYSTMLHYMVKGVDDPDAGNIYRNLVRKSHVIGQRAQRLQRLKEHPGEKYSLMQKSLSSSLSLQSLHSSLAKCCATLHDLQSNPNPRKSIQDHETLRLSEERQSQLLTLFNWVWTSDMWHSSDYEETKSMLTSETLGSYEKSLLVSALTLSLTEMFDDKKLMLLFDSYDREDANVRMRAVVGIVLILRLYDSYIDIFPSVKSRLSLLYDNERFVEDTYMVMMQLQYSKLTDQVSDKMRNDIIPTLIQSGKFKKTQYGLQEIDDYMTQNGENPEWHKGSKDDAAQQKIKEMAELQMEGADVYMSTFVHMKNGPFFHETGNWLMPFSVDHPSIMQVLRKLDPSSNIFGMFLLLLEHAPFCNNDKYSFAFMMDNIGKSGQEMIIQNLSGGMSASEMQEQMEDMKKGKVKDSDLSRQYIHDLYRFFVAYPFHHQFENPFDKTLPAFHPLPTKKLHPLLQHKERLQWLGEFFMRKEQYADATSLFLSLSPQEREDDAPIWQKIGFCQQKSGDMESALESYTTAYSLAPNSQWTLKHLARVSYQLNRYSESEVYYDLLLSDDENNLNYLKRKADCMTKDNRYADAIPLLYKIYYLDEDSPEVQEELGLCHLMTSNTEKSKEFYSRLSSSHPDNGKYMMNLANVFYIEKDLETAYHHYRIAYALIRKESYGARQFKRMFVDSAKQLKPLGIDVSKFQMMYDAVCLDTTP